MSKAYSGQASLLVLVFTGTDSSHAEYEVTVRAFEQLISDAVDRTAIGIVVVAPEHAQPNAYWRKRFAEVHRTAKHPLYIGVITKSVLIRGVITAIDWLLRSQVNYHSQAFATFEDAVASYEKELRKPMDTLRVLYRQANDANHALPRHQASTQ